MPRLASVPGRRSARARKACACWTISIGWKRRAVGANAPGVDPDAPHRHPALSADFENLVPDRVARSSLRSRRGGGGGRDVPVWFDLLPSPRSVGTSLRLWNAAG